MAGTRWKARSATSRRAAATRPARCFRPRSTRIRWVRRSPAATFTARRASVTPGPVHVRRLLLGPDLDDPQRTATGYPAPRYLARDQLVRRERGRRAVRDRPGRGGCIESSRPEFSDIATSTFIDDIHWMFYEGITGGCGGSKFCPTSNVTRVQMAQFLVRRSTSRPLRPTTSPTTKASPARARSTRWQRPGSLVRLLGQRVSARPRTSPVRRWPSSWRRHSTSRQTRRTAFPTTTARRVRARSTGWQRPA